ncbi:MAG: trypsin-like peptidase domain-containing protein [bacterium]
MNVTRADLAAFVLASIWLWGVPALAQTKPELWIEGKGGNPQRDAALKYSTYASLAEKVSPAVVNIVVTFRDGSEASGEGIGLGSGFIIHPTGLFLTNNHVVEGADTVKVRLFDNREMDADFVGIDPETDIALMRIVNAKDLPTVTLGDSDRMSVGAPVVAVGNPLGLGHTITAGIISALGRRNLNPGGKDNSADFIQTDASINPGNSGGPLLSADGEVIGINTAVNRSAQGIGFALPINVVKALLPQLHDNGFVRRAWLGVRVQEVTPTLAKSFGMKRPTGALITEIVEKSPGQKAGFMAEDVVLSFAGTEIRTSDALPWLVSTHTVGTTAEAVVLRDGKQKHSTSSSRKCPTRSFQLCPKKQQLWVLRDSLGSKSNRSAQRSRPSLVPEMRAAWLSRRSRRNRQRGHQGCVDVTSSHRLARPMSQASSRTKRRSRRTREAM